MSLDKQSIRSLAEEHVDWCRSIGRSKDDLLDSVGVYLNFQPSWGLIIEILAEKLSAETTGK